MFIDTSGFLCFLDDRDFRHEAASSYFQNARSRLTHSYVLTELVALAASRGFSRKITLGFLSEIFNDPRIEIVWADDYLTEIAVDFLTKRMDKSWSLCDAVSFLVMDDNAITDALTTDHHFEQAGFVRLLEG